MKPLFARAGWIVLGLGLLAGCDEDEYTVEMTPKGDAFERTLTYAITPNKKNPDKEVSSRAQARIDHLETLYGPGEWIEEGRRRVFSGLFETDTPDDIGGRGSYTRYASALGSSTLYTERFRGSDDLSAQLAAVNHSANAFADLLIGWFAQEIGAHPGYAQVHSLLDHELRSDLANLLVYWWADDVVEHAGEGRRKGRAAGNVSELQARMVQYLLERDYLRMEELPLLVRSFETEQPGEVLGWIQRVLARKMGVSDGEPVPGVLEFLRDPAAVEASLTRFAETTAIYQQALAEWEASENRTPGEEPPAPNDVLSQHLVELALLDYSSGAVDAVKIRLACGIQPEETNGFWNAEEGVVEWSFRTTRDRTLPAFCFAQWSEPATAEQVQRFGAVILRARDLLEYNLWYASLDADETARWDAFVDTWSPADELVSRIENFRFPGETINEPETAGDRPASLADTPRRILRRVLPPKEEPPGAPPG